MTAKIIPFPLAYREPEVEVEVEDCTVQLPCDVEPEWSCASETCPTGGSYECDECMWQNRNA